MEEKFVIRGLGGKRALSGAIPVFGAKNAALKAMAAALLFGDEVAIENVPAIEDVNRMGELLRCVGAGVVQNEEKRLVTVTAPADSDGIFGEAAKRMRSSVVLTGPLLARYGRVVLPHPGGCVIGPRPIDQFLRAYRKMGAAVSENGGRYVIEADGGLVGADIFFTVTSHTATEAVMMAAVLARGTTRLGNASAEPEIAALAGFLDDCGAKIRGAGTHSIVIEGVPELYARGAAYRTMPDRIETGSFLILGALAARELAVTGCAPEHVGMLVELLREAGAEVIVGGDTITVRGRETYAPVDVRTQGYPGFPTDLQAPMAVFLSQANGEASVFETVFEGRFRYVPELSRMGADIEERDSHQIVVRGPAALSGTELESPDLRAGLAYILAATVAEGRSVIHNVYNIDRGYEKIEERLRDIGVDIKRV